ncbi:MAG: NAD(P)H-dependent oxidoreductase [Rhizobiaceae bacterium]
MNSKRIFILNGHPGQGTLSRTFAEAYAKAASSRGHSVRIAHLAELEFDMDFGHGGYENWKPLEPALEKVLTDIEWSEHLVLATPMWWGGLPAKLKGLIDRAFLPGRTFDTRNTTAVGLPKPLLTGRSARVIVTTDTPGWFLRLAYKNALTHQLGGQILRFVGFKPARFTYLVGASNPKRGMVERWISEVETLGKAAS